VTRLAFTADLHASDYGQRVDPETGLNARFLDALDIARWVALDAKRRECDALIVGGDVTEERHPSPWREAMIREALAGFEGPVILVRGNHDGMRAGRSIIDNLAAALSGPDHGFSRPGIAWVGRTAICALPYLDRHWLRAQDGFEAVPDADIYRVLGEQYLAIARGLYAEAHAEHADLESAVLVVHQSLGGGRMSAAQEAFLSDLSLVVDTGALAAIGWTAVLAGHFHRHQVIPQSSLVLYAGSPHRVSFAEEHEDKGYVVIDTDVREVDDATVWHEFVRTPARRWVTVDYATDAISFPDVDDAVVRAINVPADVTSADVILGLGLAGAADVTEVRHVRPTSPEAATGLSESMTPEQALAEYLAGDPDREALLELHRELMAEVA